MAVTRIKNNQITDSTINAAAKVQSATITGGLLANNITYNSDFTVAGNLTVQGNTTTIDTNITTIEDPVILLASTQTGSPSVDIGFIGERGTSDNIAFVWDESADEFVTAFTSTGETNTTISISSYANFHTNDANIGGNIVINGTTSFVGNITGAVSFSGNITGGNILTGGVVSATGNVTGGNLLTGGAVSATANVTGGNVVTAGAVSAASVSSSGNVTGGNVNTGGSMSATATITGGNLATGGTVSATGNVTGGNVITAGAVSAASTSASGNVTGGNLVTAGAVSAATGVVTGNITGGNVLTGGLISATGTITSAANIIGGNLTTGGQISATGNINGSGAVFSGNVSAQNFIGNISGNIDAGGANTQVQFNDNEVLNGSAGFTFDKTSNAVTVSGNITGGNVLTGGVISSTGNVTGGNLVTAGLVTATGNIRGGNIVSTGNVDATSAFVNAGAVLASGRVEAGTTMSAAGNITGANLITAGAMSAVTGVVTGNITGGNILTGGLISATGTITSAANVIGGNVNTGGVVSATGNVQGGNLVTSGAVSAATGVVTGNITGGNLLTGGAVSATGNLIGASVNTDDVYSSGALTLNAASGNLNLLASGNIVLDGGKYINNVLDPVQAQDAATKQYVDDAVSAGIHIHTPVYLEANSSVNGTYAQGGNTYTVNQTIAGNTVVFTTAANLQPNDQLWFTSSFEGIVANVAYFVVSAPNTSAAVLSTSYNGIPVSTITSNTGLSQGVRVNSGVGATLTNAGANATLVVDGVTVSNGQRILIYSQANAVHNGVYVVSNAGNATSAWVLTRATDADTYIPDDSLGLDEGSYFYVQAGDTGAGESYVQTAPSGPFIIGYNNITFTQFSASQVYTANTSAGLSLTGTVFSAKVDNNTTAFDGSGNIIVKASANLTTPNIGAATGTSLSVTGNITGGNVNTGGAVSATANVTGGNLVTAGLVTGGNLATGGTVSATGNVTGGNVITAGAVSAASTSVNGNIIGGNVNTGGIVSATGNITGGNLITAGAVSAASTSASGNITGGNVNTGGIVSAVGNLVTGANVVATANLIGGNVSTVGLITSTGNITGGNVLTGGLVSATGTITSAANITGANVNTGGVVSATGTITGGNLATGGTMSATGNVTGGNVLTGGLVSATGTITSAANIIGGNLTTGGQISATGNINGSGAVFSGNVSAQNFIGNISGNIDAGGSNTQVQFNDGDILNGTAGFTFNKTSNLVTITGNVQGGNLLTGGLISATGNITSAANVAGGNIIATTLVQGTTVSASGNVIGGNVTTGGQVSATANVTGGNINTAGLISATGNINGSNLILSSGFIDSSAARITINGSDADVDFAVDGDTNANIFYVDAGTGTASFGSSTQTTNALVAFNTSTSILMPVGNTGQRPGTGVTGMMRFNTTNNNLEVYDNSEWSAVGVPSFTVIADQQFNGDGSTVAFTLSTSQTTNSCIVSINGVVQIPTVAYSVSGTTLTFTEAPLSGDVIDVRQITTTTTVISISNSSGNAVVGVSDTANTVQITGDLVPAANGTQSLGTASLRWKDVFAAGNSIILGNVVMKNVAGGNTIAFYGPDGTTPATIASSSVDTTTIANGTSSVAVVTSGGNIRANVAGSTVALVTSSGVQITGDLSVTGNATLSGNILGDRIQNGTTQIDIQTINGNANVTVGGTSNVAVFATTGVFVTGVNSVSGNVTGGNINTGGVVSATGNVTGGNVITAGAVSAASTSASGNITGGNVNTGGVVSATGAITGASLNVSTGNITNGNLNLSGNIVDTGAISIITSSNGNISLSPNGTGNVNISGNVMPTANATANIGSATLSFNTIFAKATSAQYADLAEKYVADAEYAPGTVVCFGGSKEVTVTSGDADTKVAGVVSTNPSYIMNGGLEAEYVATVALTGRVPCRVTGTVRKGDLMVSAGYGLARADANPRVGTVIGKALADFDGQEGVIEVVVGRF